MPVCGCRLAGMGAKRKLTEDEAQRRRRAPPYAERPDDYRYTPDDLSEKQWRECAALYAEGWSSERLGERYGRSGGTIRRGMRVREVKKKPKAQRAVKAPPRGLSALPRLFRDPEARAAAAFVIVEGDIEATRASLDRSRGAAAIAGLTDVVVGLSNADVALGRSEAARRRETERLEMAALRRRALPTRSRGDHPGLEGEGEAAGREIKLRDEQKPPADRDWSTWLFLGGRGAGKTLAGASWIADMADALGPDGRLALVGPTLHDVREVMIGGVSGVMSLPRWPGGERPKYVSSRRTLTFPNGAVAQVFSAEDPDSLRGPQFAAAWADEMCAWSRGEETLAMLRLALRLGAEPKLVVTTTPRPTRLLKGLRGEPGCAESHAGTMANAANLAPGFVDSLRALYGGTRREAQELEGLVVDAEGSLFTAAMIAACRGGEVPEAFDRVVVGVDPTASAAGDACGIVVVGRLGKRAWVLADQTVTGRSPEGWARRVLETARTFKAQALIAEVNQGGEMVRSVLRAVGWREGEITLKEVRATQGKAARAEPVAALYEQGRVFHTRPFTGLEEELMALGAEEARGSRWDRADALVWALTALMIDRGGEGPRMRQIA